MTTSLSALQEQANAKLKDLPALSNKLEDWRYVDFKSIAEDLPAASTSKNSDVPEFIDSLSSYVIDNGEIAQEQLNASWSKTEQAQVSAALTDLAASNSPHALACIDADSKQYAFSIKGVCEDSQAIILRSSGGSYGMHIHIHAHKGSIASVVLIHDHQEHSSCNYALHVHAEADSVIHIDEINLNANAARIYHHKYVDADKNAQVHWQSFSAAQGIDRHYWDANLHAIGAHCSLGNASMCSDSFQAHHVINVKHLSPSCTSSQLFKSIARDQSRYSFNGLVHMANGADECSANQQNANLQLSPKARIHSRPQLDIHTDDVIATHGSATGQVSDEELYYLRTRGLNKEQAERIIVRGFLQEVSHQFNNKICRQWADQEIINGLS